jgi:N-acetylmuramoyl-L-alanine amidase
MSHKLKFLIIHCTATPAGREVSVQDIINWHTSPQPDGRGWSRPGYSKIIHLDGTIEQIWPVDDDGFINLSEITNGASGYNLNSIHIVYAGGINFKTHSPEDTRTPKQISSLKDICYYYKNLHPSLLIIGHNQISNKACPCFSVPRFLHEINLYNDFI